MTFGWLVILLSVAGVANSQYNTTFQGDLTYFGLQSPPGSGHCSSQFSGSDTQPWTTGVTAFVALNAPQYADSSPCGMCIAYEALGPGSGATQPPLTYTYAQVSDECPECKSGDLDIGLNGDGRWSGQWFGVACDTGNTGFYYSTQGSNNYFLKLQVSNTAFTVGGVQLQIGDGSYATLSRSIDNYWQLFSASAIAIPASIKVTSTLGQTVTDTWAPSSISGPPVQGTAQFSVPAGFEVVGSRSPGGVPSATSAPASTPAPVSAAPGATESAATTPTPTAAAASAQSADCSSPVNPWDQCGGMGGQCQALGGCVNGTLPGLCCSQGFVCTEINSWFYYCSRDTSTAIESASSLITIPDYNQCGGSVIAQDSDTLDVVPRDAAWNGTQCSNGFQCVRFDQYTWQCRDVPNVIPAALNAPVSSSKNGSGIESGNSQVSLTQAACYA